MGETPEVLGPYVIYERLGAGGMATVHRAEQVGVAGFRKPIALKRLLPHVADDRSMLDMFIHEARLASQLRHANVAATYDLGKVDDTYFIAMEYVPGPTLTQIMKQCGTAAGPMPVPMVVAILLQLLDALDHAHNLADDMGRALGIIHRDISPSNIIVSTSGVVKLIDFGIAKASTGGVQTQTGLIKGKYAYIAPEYMQGQLDSRADLFGVGIIAHELLATKRLFNAPTDYETLERLRSMPIVAPSRLNKDVPADLDDIVLTALQRDPDQRWQSAAAMRNALTNVARSLKGGAISNQQLADWVEWAFGQVSSDDDDDDDLTRARHVERAGSASDAADPTIPPPAPASARPRAGRVVNPRALSVEETPSPELSARAKMLASRTADLAARSAQMAKQAEELDAALFDDSADTSDDNDHAAKRRLDASEYDIEMVRADDSALTPPPLPTPPPALFPRSEPLPNAFAPVAPTLMIAPAPNVTAPVLNPSAPVHNPSAPAGPLVIPTSMPLGGPARPSVPIADVPALASRSSRPSEQPLSRPTLIDAVPPLVPVKTATPVVGTVDAKPAAPAAQAGPRRWPWILLAIVVAGVGAGTYVYFFGFDLPRF